MANVPPTGLHSFSNSLTHNSLILSYNSFSRTFILAHCFCCSFTINQYSAVFISIILSSHIMVHLWHSLANFVRFIFQPLIGKCVSTPLLITTKYWYFFEFHPNLSALHTHTYSVNFKHHFCTKSRAGDL